MSKKKDNPNLAVSAAPYDPAITKVEFPLPKGGNLHVQTYYTVTVEAELLDVEKVQGPDNGVTGYVFLNLETQEEFLVPAVDLLAIEGSPKAGPVHVSYIYRQNVLEGRLIGQAERGPFGLLKMNMVGSSGPVFVPYHRAIITK